MCGSTETWKNPIYIKLNIIKYETDRLGKLLGKFFFEVSFKKQMEVVVLWYYFGCYGENQVKMGINRGEP